MIFKLTKTNELVSNRNVRLKHYKAQKDPPGLKETLSSLCVQQWSEARADIPVKLSLGGDESVQIL